MGLRFCDRPLPLFCKSRRDKYMYHIKIALHVYLAPQCFLSWCLQKICSKYHNASVTTHFIKFYVMTLCCKKGWIMLKHLLCWKYFFKDISSRGQHALCTALTRSSSPDHADHKHRFDVLLHSGIQQVNKNNIPNKIVAAFCVTCKHSYAWLPRKCDYRTDRRRTKWSLCIAMCRCALQATQKQNSGNIPRKQVSPAKHSCAWLPRKCDYQTDRQTPDKVIPMRHKNKT